MGGDGSARAYWRGTLRSLWTLFGPFLGLLLITLLFAWLTRESGRFMTADSWRLIAAQSVIVAVAALGMTAVMIADDPQNADDASFWLSGTDQILVTRNTALLQHEKIRAAAQPIQPRPSFRAWTDDFNNLLTVLK